MGLIIAVDLKVFSQPTAAIQIIPLLAVNQIYVPASGRVTRSPQILL